MTTEEKFGMTVALTITIASAMIVFLVALVDGAALEAKNTKAAVARCKSLQGEYGGGKCFKDGKEV